MNVLDKEFEAFLNSIGQTELKKNKALKKVITKLSMRIGQISKYYSEDI